jgi:ATP-dependent RNA helicase RhlE
LTFETLGLSEELLRAIGEQGYSRPTPVQEQVIPAILQGSDVMAGSQTGTGKTASFTLPLLHLLSGRPKRREKYSVRALILTPTRELAAQVGKSVSTYGKHLSLKSAVVFGGTNINPQAKILQSGVDILIATPGRLLDLVGQRFVDLSQIEILVLDEADRMLDMGFIHDIKRILNLLPKGRQNLLFSATFSDEIKKLVDGLFRSPKTIEVARRNAPAEGVAQVIYPVDTKKKRALLTHLIVTQKWKQALVFTRTKHGANRLAELLEMDGISTRAFHGNKSQPARLKALADFKNGDIQVLVATDIAARGIDIQELPHVVNYELPNVPEDYVHRIGRTGRAGHEGNAVSLVSIDEHKFLRDIERLLKKEIPRVIEPGYEVDPSIKAVPPQMRGQRTGPRPSWGGGSSQQRDKRAPSRDRRPRFENR